MNRIVIESLGWAVLCNIGLKGDIESEALSCYNKAQRHLHVVNVTYQ